MPRDGESGRSQLRGNVMRTRTLTLGRLKLTRSTMPLFLVNFSYSVWSGANNRSGFETRPTHLAAIAEGPAHYLWIGIDG